MPEQPLPAVVTSTAVIMVIRRKFITFTLISKPSVTVRVEALKAEDSAPPAMVLLPEAMRRIQDMTAMFEGKAASFPDTHVLLVNSSHPLVENLLSLSGGSIALADGSQSPAAELGKMLCNHIYDLALMAQKGFDADGMKSFVSRSNQVLTQLTKQ